MNSHSINKYYIEVEKIIRHGGITNETAIRNAFYNLLNEYVQMLTLGSTEVS